MEPGTGSTVVKWAFYVLVVMLFGAIVLMLARTAFLTSLLWIMPIARVLSFVPGVRRWIERRTATAADERRDAGA